MNSADLERCINAHRQDAAHCGFLRGLAVGIVAASIVALAVTWMTK